MKISFELIKQIISILCTFSILGAFIVTELYVKTKGPTFIEYTNLFKFLLNLYILLFYYYVFSILYTQKVFVKYLQKN